MALTSVQSMIACWIHEREINEAAIGLDDRRDLADKVTDAIFAARTEALTECVIEIRILRDHYRKEGAKPTTAQALSQSMESAALMIEGMICTD